MRVMQPSSIYSRRFFLRLAGMTAAAAAAAPRPAFEVSASLYAWDLVDQSCEEIMQTLKETAQANSLYLVALMHHELRPLTDFYFPHNSRKTYFPEDSRI